MTDHTMILNAIQTLSLSPSPNLEDRVAKAILEWLDAQTLYTHYYDLIKELRGLDNYDMWATRSLRFNLWMNSNACMWPAPCQIKSSDDLTWQFAIIRASKLLNSPAANIA
jgi:hypothetical protein